MHLIYFINYLHTNYSIISNVCLLQIYNILIKLFYKLFYYLLWEQYNKYKFNNYNQCKHYTINQKLLIQIVYGITKIIKHIYKNLNVVNVEIVIILHNYCVCYCYESVLFNRIALLQHIKMFEFFFYIN